VVVSKKSLSYFFHSLIPVELQKSLDPNSSVYMRVQALSALMVILSALGIAGSLVMVLLHFLAGKQEFTYELMLVSMTTLIVLQAWAFYRYKNYWFSGLIFTIFYFLAAMLVIIGSGGYDAPDKVFLVTCPMITFLIVGWRDGLYTSVLTAAFGVALVLLKSIGFQLPNMFGSIDEYTRFMFVWALTLAITLACFLIYESELLQRHRAPDTYADNARNRMVKFDSKLQGFLHSLIPAGLRDRLDTHSWLYARIQILTLLLWAATLISLSSIFLFIPFHFVSQPDLLKYDIVIAAIALLFALQVWAFYKFKNHQFSGTLLGYFCFFLVLALVILSGGYDAPAVTLLITIPIAFFIVGGIQHGIQNAIFVVLAGVMFALLKRRGFEFTNIFHDGNPPMVFAFIWVITIAGISLCLLAYDTRLEDRQ
jgi:hypothetical protein